MPLAFGIGYTWRPNESNLLLAIKTGEVPETTATIPNYPPAEADNTYARRQPYHRDRQDRYWDDRRLPDWPPPFPFFLFGPR